jgi:hypothetical protein
MDLGVKLLIMAFNLSKQLVTSMSWLEVQLHAFWNLALKSDFKIDDHGVRWAGLGLVP